MPRALRADACLLRVEVQAMAAVDTGGIDRSCGTLFGGSRVSLQAFSAIR